eukprot:CAMPEP_0114982582 /NCGR_PEP_ID=MMETSP0216-20121206/6209_1 /TAXON_ID=223996 /ORGANISM="Protocruzia adherens, Strain Boccale" /LENGTH=285 /DNA_ID=CAMNT_0002344439 /DNA_START=762 /DNA_END=1619 /DNA_ORIENTATION=-
MVDKKAKTDLKLNKVVFANLIKFCDFKTVSNCLTLNKQLSQVVIDWSKEVDFWRILALGKFPDMFKMVPIDKDLMDPGAPEYFSKLSQISRCGIACHELKENDEEESDEEEDNSSDAEKEKKYILSKIENWQATFQVLKFREYLEKELKDVTMDCFAGSEGGAGTSIFVLYCKDACSDDEWDIDDVLMALDLDNEIEERDETFIGELKGWYEEEELEETIDQHYEKKGGDQAKLWKMKAWFENNGVKDIKSLILGEEGESSLLPYLTVGVYKKFLIGILSYVVWT